MREQMFPANSVLGGGVGRIKRQIRNIERLITKHHDSLDDTVLVEKERELEALRLELIQTESRSLSRKNSRRYHMVRFFERKKALRRYRKAISALKNGDGNSELQAQLRKCEVDLCYVVNFPKTRKYISLYPNHGEMIDEQSDETKNLRKKYLELISCKLNEGTLPVCLEDILKGKKLALDQDGVELEDKQRNLHDSEVRIAVGNIDEDDFFE